MNIINIIIANHFILITIFGIIGLIVGSFLNVVIYRLPIILKADYRKDCLEYLEQQPNEHSTFNFAIPRSHCPQCKTTLLWWHNIPIISFIILRGKCYFCKSPISWRYPTIEILSCITTLLIGLYFGIDIKTPPMLILTWTLIAAIFIDIDHQLLPDHITLSLMWLGLWLNSNYIFTSPQNAISGAIFGYLSLWTINKVFKLIRKVEGMGHGDFKLFAALGAWLGWQSLPIIILIASIMGAAVGLTLVVTDKHKFKQPLPFGPYLAIAGWLTFFFEPLILNWYKFYF